MALFMSVLMVITVLPFNAFVFAANKPVMEAYTAASSADYHKYYNQVVTITFCDSIDYSYENTEFFWDVSAAKDGSVRAWMKVNPEATALAGKDRYDVFIGAEGGVYANPSSNHMFYMFSSLEYIYDAENFKTGDVTTFYDAFYGCTSLKEVDFSSWDVSNVTTLKYMFTL